MRRIFLLLTLLYLSAQFLAAQDNAFPLYQFPAAKTKVLLGFQPGTSLSRISQILATEPCFLSPDERMYVQAPTPTIIAWLDPSCPTRPATDPALYRLLDRLATFPEVRYAHPFIDAGQDLRGVTDRVFVKLQPGTSYSKLQAQAEAWRMTILGENPYIKNLYLLQADKSALGDPVSLAIAFQQRPEYAYAEPDYLLNPVVTTNDPFFNRQWSIQNTGGPAQGNGTPGADMSVTDAWTITTGDSTIRIAIIDSGTDTTHEDLRDNLLPGFDASGGNSNGYPNTTYPSDAHGTNCAGIVAAKADNGIGIAGICPECSIFPVKVFYYLFNPFGEPIPYASGSAMADAISWAWQVGDADVMSNSWGLLDNLLPILPGGTAVVEDAIHLALDSARHGKGGILLFSSGNDGGSPIWPGRLDGVFAVNATSMCDERKHPGSCDGQNWEGNWGANLDISAPGVQIAATDMMGTAGYAPSHYSTDFGGTSAACPNAAGVMGLILSVSPHLSLSQAHFVIESTCDKVGGYDYSTQGPNGGWSDELGYGRINAHSALLAAQNVVSAPAPADPAQADIQSWWSPTLQQIEVAATLAQPDALQIQLWDLQGRQITAWSTGTEKKTLHRLSLQAPSAQISEGIYLLRIQSSNTFACDKILITK